MEFVYNYFEGKKSRLKWGTASNSILVLLLVNQSKKETDMREKC